MITESSSHSSNHYRGSLYLLMTALVWGVAFVPQRIASAHIEAGTFNAIKYLGATILMLALFWKTLWRHVRVDAIGPTVTLGFFLFAGSVLQQVGVASTTAGKAGFITGLYMVFTPVLLLTVWRTRISVYCWLGAFMALLGLALLCVDERLSIGSGDLWVVGSALMFSLQLIYGNRFVLRHEPITLATGQYLFCGVFSACSLLLSESPTRDGIVAAAPSLAYMIFFSTGIGYTLALFGQRYVKPEVAALIMALEAVFAALAGWLVLEEQLALRQLFGCLLMLVGCVVAQRASPQSTSPDTP